MAAISAALCLGSVQNQCHVLELLLLVEGIHLRQHTALHQAGTNHEDGTIGKLFVYWGICDDLDRWTVDEYIIILLAHGLNHLLKQWSEEKLGWVGRNGSNRNHIKILNQSVFFTLIEDVVDVGDSTIQVIAQSLARTMNQHRG